MNLAVWSPVYTTGGQVSLRAHSDMLLPLLGCVLSCSFCNSDNIVMLVSCRCSRAGGRFSLELNSITIIPPPTVHAPANIHTTQTPGGSAYFTLSVCVLCGHFL